MKNILLIADSIAMPRLQDEVIISLEETYPEILRVLLPEYFIEVKADFSLTTQRVLERGYVPKKHPYELLILQIGIVDVRYDYEPNKIIENIKEIIASFKEIIFIDPPHLIDNDEALVKRVSDLSKVYQKTILNNNLILLSELTKTNPRFLHIDGMHLNYAGAQALALIIKDKIEEIEK